MNTSKYVKARRLVADLQGRIIRLQSEITTKEASLFLMYRSDGSTVDEAKARARRDLAKPYTNLARLKADLEKAKAELDIQETAIAMEVQG